VHVSDSFALAGPWIKPEMSMQKWFGQKRVKPGTIKFNCSSRVIKIITHCGICLSLTTK
jgi:hypothetical protein